MICTIRLILPQPYSVPLLAQTTITRQTVRRQDKEYVSSLPVAARDALRLTGMLAKPVHRHRATVRLNFPKTSARALAWRPVLIGQYGHLDQLIEFNLTLALS